MIENGKKITRQHLAEIENETRNADTAAQPTHFVVFSLEFAQ